MKVPFYIGWAILLLAFAAAAAEIMPRSLPSGGGLFVSAHQLWYAAWPGNLVVTQIRVEAVSPWLWDPLAVTVLKAPAWALLGVPGAFVTWFFRPHKEMTRHEREELEKQEESLYLFDRLAREAHDSGIGLDEDDQLPDYSSHDLFDGRGLTAPYSEDDLLQAYADDAPDGAGGADGAEPGDDGSAADEPPTRH